MIVWIIRSSTQLNKEILTVAVLITQPVLAEYFGKGLEYDPLVRGSSLTGTMINLFVGKRHAPIIYDMFIVPGGAWCFICVVLLRDYTYPTEQASNSTLSLDEMQK